MKYIACSISKNRKKPKEPKIRIVVIVINLSAIETAVPLPIGIFSFFKKYIIEKSPIFPGINNPALQLKR